MSSSESASDSGFKLNVLQLGAGFGAGVVSVPASLALSMWVGSLSSNLLLAALPAVAIFVALPALAVTFAEWAVGNRLSEGSARLSPAVWAAVGVQVLVMAGAMLMGVHGQNLVDVGLLTLVDAALLSGSVFGVMKLTSPRPASAPSARAPAVIDLSRPSASRVLSLPVAAWSF